MTGRWLATIAVAFALAGPVSSANAGVPVAKGTTVVTARTTAKTTIYLPTRTPVRATVQGAGRLAGVILRERHSYPEEAGHVRVMGSDYAWGDTLRKGRYTVYVVTDGKPVTVTLRFGRLSGSARVAATTPVRSGMVPYTESVDAPVAWSAGAAVSLSGPADIFTAAWWKQDESAVASSAGCWYDGKDGVEELGEYRWLPGCPFGTSGTVNEVRNPTGPPGPLVRGGAHLSVGRSHSDAGRHGMGTWVQAQNVRDTGGFAYWIAH